MAIRDVSNSDDILDVRDIIKRVEELDERHDELFEAANDEEAKPEDKAQAEKEFAEWQAEEGGECAERATLRGLLDDLKGYGGDEQWQGDWYPITLVREDHFEDFAREEAEELYSEELGKAKWPFTCIDWEKAASELRGDYSTVEFDGVEYLYR